MSCISGPWQCLTQNLMLVPNSVLLCFSLCTCSGVNNYTSLTRLFSFKVSKIIICNAWQNVGHWLLMLLLNHNVQNYSIRGIHRKMTIFLASHNTFSEPQVCDSAAMITSLWAHISQFTPYQTCHRIRIYFIPDAAHHSLIDNCPVGDDLSAKLPIKEGIFVKFG